MIVHAGDYNKELYFVHVGQVEVRTHTAPTQHTHTYTHNTHKHTQVLPAAFQGKKYTGSRYAAFTHTHTHTYTHALCVFL